MSDEHRDLDDCTKGAQDSLVDILEGGKNYLRANGCDNVVSDLLFEIADGATPTYTGDLLDVFGEATELWYSEPDCGMEGTGGVVGVISRVIYDAIYEALQEFVNDLEGDDLECDAEVGGVTCNTPDDHDPLYGEADPDHVRCKAHCDGAPECKPCQEAQDAEADDDDVASAKDSGNCPNCGRTLPRRAPATAPPETIPYTQQVDMGQKCRHCGSALREHLSTGAQCPNAVGFNFQAVQAPEGRITHQECGCPVGGARGHRHHRINTGRTPAEAFYWGQATNAYTVGLTDGTGERHGFATEDQAATYISTLPDHADGRYYLDGPPDDGPD